MPARKKRASKKKTASAAVPPPPAPEPVVTPPGNYADEAARARGELLQATHGEKFNALVEAYGSDPIPISWLIKVAGPTLEGHPPATKANPNWKDRYKAKE